jgi:RNA recognition motif-containing protein
MDKLNMSLDDIIKKDRSGKKPHKPKHSHNHPYQRTQNNGGLKQNKSQSREKIEKSGPLTTSGKSAPLFTKSGMENKEKAAPISIAQIRGLTTKSAKAQASTANNNNNNGNNSTTNTQRQPAKKPQHITIKGEAGPCVLSVSNLDRGATASDVEQCFMKFGEITNIVLFYDQYQQSTGNAEITFKAKKEALSAIDNLNNAVADGHVLSVQLKPTTSNPGTPVASGGQQLKSSQKANNNGSNESRLRSQQKGGDRGQSQSSNLYSDRLARNRNANARG